MRRTCRPDVHQSIRRLQIGFTSKGRRPQPLVKGLVPGRATGLRGRRICFIFATGGHRCPRRPVRAAVERPASGSRHRRDTVEAGVIAERGVGRRDRERQRRPGAQIDDLVHRGGLGRGPAGTEPRGQQGAGLAWTERGQDERARPLGGDQAGEGSRLVTTTRLPAAPGSSGRTCAALSASSRTTSVRRPSMSERYRSTCSSTSRERARRVCRAPG